jgi:8-amino-7-oxononanoate synthase
MRTNDHVAVILGNDSVRNTIMNFARSVIYTTAPSFPTVAGIRAGYKLMSNGDTQKVRMIAIAT